MIQHISAEEVDVSEDENASPNPESSVFDRLQSSTSKKRPSVFAHIRKGKDNSCYVFNRIKDHPQPKPSIFTKIGAGEKSLNSQLQHEKSYAFSRFGVINEVQSSIPSCMKRFSSLDVKTDGSLRVKRRTVVFTGQQKNSNSIEETEKDKAVSSNHITIHECDNSGSEIELAETPKILEDRGRLQLMI